MRQDETHQPIHGTHWKNTDIAGAVSKESAFRLQDDFHAAVNRNWLVQAEIHPGNSSESSFWEVMRTVEKRIIGLLEEKTLAAESHEAELAQALWNAFLDMPRRNTLGIEPIKTYLNRI